MSRLLRYLRAQAYNNAWANERLLTAVGRLDDEAFAAPRTGFFPSLKATLNHIIAVDWFYLGALERGLAGLPLDPRGRDCFDPEEPFTTCAPLHEAQRLADRRLVELCRSLTEAQLDLTIAVPWRTKGQETVERLLAHLFQHQVHHRGQAHAMMAGTAVAPPQLDEFFCSGDAKLRAPELARLGLSEREIES